MINIFETNQKLLFPYIDARFSPCLSTGYKYKVPLLTDCYMSDITQEYCLCDACISPSYEQLYYYQTKPISDSKMNEIQLDEYALPINSDLKTKVISNQYSKRRFLDTIDFDLNITILLSKIKRVTDERKVVIHKKKKSTARVRLSTRRSHYTGVFKNGDNWQALISIYKRKTYIGTYTSEIEAAKMFDFYSILLNNLTASTNFDYTKKDILEMIESFVSNDGKYKLQ